MSVDVRIVATTTRRLRPLVDAGRLCRELFDCVSVATVVVPPLRERRGDVALMAAYVLEHLESDRPLQLDESAHELLRAHPWPGNVRELVQALERAAILAHGPVITAADLEDGAASPLRIGLGSLAGLTVREVERRLIVDTLARTRNNRTQAAKLLGISIRTLRNKLAEYRARGECVLAREPCFTRGCLGVRAGGCVMAEWNLRPQGENHAHPLDRSGPFSGRAPAGGRGSDAGVRVGRRS